MLALHQRPMDRGGDFNCSPQSLSDIGFLKLVDGVIHAPIDHTCNGKCYDYFVVSRLLSPAVLGVHVVSDAAFSPHFPVRLLLRAAPRVMLLQQLKKPSGFGAKLPAGPVNAECTHDAATAAAIADSDDSSVDGAFAELMPLIERQLSSVAGFSPTEQSSHSGRVSGPKLVWRPAVKDVAGLRRTSPAHSALALTAKWLRALQLLPAGSKGAERLWRAIRAHKHSGKQCADLWCLEQWQAALPERACVSGVLAKALIGVADHMRDKLAACAVERSRADWTSWLHEGPARGLGRQHKMSRTAQGWIPSAEHQVDASSAGDEEEVAAVLMHNGPCPWGKPIHITTGATCPNSLQQEADAEADQWGNQ